MLNLLFPEKVRYKRGEGFRNPQNPPIFAARPGFYDPREEMAHPKGFEPLAF